MKFIVTTLSKRLWPLALILSLLVMACGGSSEGTKVGEKEVSDATKAPPKIETYVIGDVIQIKEYTITLTEASLNSEILKATFLIENKGDSEMSVSSLLSFSAKDGEGAKLETEIFDCGSSLDGKILAGDRLKGSICWSGVKAGDTVRVYYEDNLFSSGATVWELNSADLGVVTKENEEPAVEEPPAEADSEPVTEAEASSAEDPDTEPAGESQESTTFKIGDVIALEDQTAILDSANIQGNLLKATFIIENLGTKDLALSSLISFYAKDSDGVKLEQNIFDCGTSMVDGSVIPGDKIKGDICWNVGANQDIKIYYEANLFGSGAVVWTITP